MVPDINNTVPATDGWQVGPPDTFREVIANTKEENINWIQNRINARSKQIDQLVERIQQMQKANSRDLLKLDEARLLKDIRDGRVKLVHAETGHPINIHVFNNPK